MDSVWPISRLVVRAGVEAGTRQGSVFGVGISFMTFIGIVMALRMYVRVKLIQAVGVDDILMALGTAMTFGLSIASMFAAHYGTGKHYMDIYQPDYIPMLKSIYSTRLLYVLSLMFVKISLLWFYLRLDQRHCMRWTVYGLLFVTLCLSISSLFVLAFSCFPPSKFWDLIGDEPGHCMTPDSQQSFYEINGVLNIVTDIFIYITPIPMLWKVQINLRKKIALFGVFGLGVLSIAAGCVRYDYVRMLASTADQYYALADALNWCSIEVYVAIFCGSAPALSVLIKTYVPRIFGSSQGEQETPISNRDQPLQKVFPRPKAPWSNRGLGTMVSTGSQEEFIPDGSIVMRTDVHVDVESVKSEVDDAKGLRV